MKDILIKREELRNRSVKLKSLKFDDKIKKDQIDVIIQEQNKIYDKWKFYNGIIKAINNKAINNKEKKL